MMNRDRASVAHDPRANASLLLQANSICARCNVRGRQIIAAAPSQVFLVTEFPRSRKQNWNENL